MIRSQKPIPAGHNARVPLFISPFSSSLWSSSFPKMSRSRTSAAFANLRVGNGYDQAQLRSIKMADAEHGEYRLSRIVSTRHLVRRPYCAWRESWDRLIFWMWETAAARSDIADIGTGVYTKFSGRLSEEPFPWPIQKFPCILIFKIGQPGCQLNLSEEHIRLDLTSGRPLV